MPSINLFYKCSILFSISFANIKNGEWSESLSSNPSTAQRKRKRKMGKTTQTYNIAMVSCTQNHHQIIFKKIVSQLLNIYFACGNLDKCVFKLIPFSRILDI
jgi:hypothetical protein